MICRVILDKIFSQLLWDDPQSNNFPFFVQKYSYLISKLISDQISTFYTDMLIPVILYFDMCLEADRAPTIMANLPIQFLWFNVHHFLLSFCLFIIQWQSFLVQLPIAFGDTKSVQQGVSPKINLLGLLSTQFRRQELSKGLIVSI